MTTAEIFDLLVRGTLAASAAIAVVLALRLPVRRLFGARIAYSLWLLAPAAALASFFPARSISIPPATTLERAASVGAAFAAPFPVETAAATAQSAFSWESLSSTLTPWLVGLWAAGFLASVAMLVLRQRRLLVRLKLSPLGANRLYRASSDRMGPALIGALSPRIVVPADFEQRFTEEERALVLAHERAHLAAWDAQLNGLAALALCAGWFNPLFHLARRLLRIDQELACDERVMLTHADRRRAYAEAMLKAQDAGAPIPLGCAWVTFGRTLGGSSLKQRIAMLRRPRLTSSRRALGASLCATLTLAACVGASAAQPARLVEAESADPVEQAQARRDFWSRLDPAMCSRWRAMCSGVENAVGDNPNADESSQLGLLLALALQNGDIESARGYIEAGADVDFYIPGDGTPLVIAAQRRDYGMARLLVEAGADVNRAAPGDGLPLIVASARGDLATAELLVSYGADVNGYVPGDETPLINAARNNHTTVARFLIEQGADVNLAIDDRTWLGAERRRSPLSEAEKNHHFEMIRLLRENGAQS